jgi:hypothetical protein
MMRRPKTTLLAALAMAPLAWAQPVPAPPAPQTAPPRSAAQAAADGPAPIAPTGVADLLQTRIEQVRRGNRVSEVRVTSAGGEARYTMDNREGRIPPPTQTLGSGLSTPNFLKIEF